MRRWGYRHVITPLVENMDVLDLGLGVDQRRRLFKFTDARGDIIALVGERTVPVARLVAGKLRGVPLPLVSYGGSSKVATFAILGLLVRVSSGPWEPSRG